MKHLQGNVNHTESTAILFYSQCCQLEFYTKEACCEYQEGHLRAVLTFIFRLSEFGVVCKEKDKERQTSNLNLVFYLPRYLTLKCFFFSMHNTGS